MFDTRSNRILINDCLITSAPNNYKVPKEERDIQYNNVIYNETFSLCIAPQKIFANGTAVIITSNDVCGLVKKIENARLSNINIIVLITDKIYLPNVKNELNKFPIVILMPSGLFNTIEKNSINSSKIGIYGSMGDNTNGDILTGFVLFSIIIVSIVLIIVITVVFNDQHYSQIDTVSNSDVKNIKWLVIICPIMMVGSLLLLYFFYNVMVWVLIILFYLGASLSFMNIAMLFFYKFNYLSNWIYPFNKYGIVNIDCRSLLCFLIGLILATVWIVNRNNMVGLVLNNIIGILLCAEIAVGFGIIFVVSKNFKLLVVLLAMTLIIDVLMVYIPASSSQKPPSNMQVNAYMMNKSLTRTRRAAGESIMERVATGTAGNSTEEVPIRFKIPQFNLNKELSTARCQNYVKSYSMVGFGDVILPGAFIVFILAFAVMTKHSVVLYSVFTLFCYITGLVITYLVVKFAERGQPALVFLLPCTVPPTLLLAFIKKDFMTLWNHTWSSDQIQNLTNEDVDDKMLSVKSNEESKCQL